MSLTLPGVLDEPPINLGCRLVTGNWYVDKFNVQCGFPLSMFLTFWLVVFITGVVFKKRVKKVWVFPTVFLCGFILYLIINMAVVQVGITNGYLLKRELWTQTRHLMLAPILGY